MRRQFHREGSSSNNNGGMAMIWSTDRSGSIEQLYFEHRVWGEIPRPKRLEEVVHLQSIQFEE